MESKLKKFASKELTKKELTKVSGGDQGIRMYLNSTCNPDGTGTVWIEKVY
ncbi:bacteriocin [Flavobacterium sp.]|uniref:bacteriocin n=1 Tax=Flavobacterium sp. TaxID=239 RepID=UPI003753B1A5